MDFPHKMKVFCKAYSKEETVYFCPGFRDHNPVLVCNGCDNCNGSEVCKKCCSSAEISANEALAKHLKS